MHITKCKKATQKGYIRYDPNCTKFWKRRNYGDSKNVSGCQGLGKGTEIFRAKKLLRDGGYMSLHIVQNPQNVQHQG